MGLKASGRLNVIHATLPRITLPDDRLQIKSFSKSQGQLYIHKTTTAMVARRFRHSPSCAVSPTPSKVGPSRVCDKSAGGMRLINFRGNQSI
jgi:hypothetical protein